MSITLPPIPLPSIDTWPNTPEKLRARDIAVAGVVLESVARWFATEGHLEATWEIDDLIRNMKAHHD